MKLGRVFSFLACLLGACASVTAVNLPTAVINEIESGADGWMRAVSGDPYITFQTGDIPVESVRYLRIKMAGKHVLNRHLYVELFWATETHGYTEEKKGFYVQPFPVGGEEPIEVLLNFGEFLEVMGDSGTRLQLIRLDLDPEMRNQDFQFQVDLEILQDAPADTAEMRFLRIHPPYLSQYLMDWRIFRYTLGCLVLDFLHKVFRDPLFLLLYLPGLAIPIACLWRLRKLRDRRVG